jgi:hypothetical protein
MKIIIRFFLTISFALILPYTSYTMYIQPSFHEIVKSSDIIVVGEIVKLESNNSNNIFGAINRSKPHSFLLKISKVFKGNIKKNKTIHIDLTKASSLSNNILNQGKIYCVFIKYDQVAKHYSTNSFTMFPYSVDSDEYTALLDIVLSDKGYTTLQVKIKSENFYHLLKSQICNSLKTGS